MPKPEALALADVLTYSEKASDAAAQYGKKTEGHRDRLAQDVGEVSRRETQSARLTIRLRCSKPSIAWKRCGPICSPPCSGKKKRNRNS